jgi:putative heme-binding domain-containing protein
MRRLNNDLNAGQGDPARGKMVFNKACASCHMLFGEGKQVGPDLTHANRSDREFLLASLIDPSAAIRKEYLAYEVETTDGRMLSGVIVEQTGGGLTLATSTGERMVLPQTQIAGVRESALSLMPEDVLKSLNPQEVRDLFAHLQSNQTSLSKP